MKVLKISTTLVATLFLSIAMASLTSCEKVVKTVTSTSPGDKVTLTFTASRSSSLDPWMVDINVKGYGHDETISTELYSNDITEKEIVVVWQDDNSASIVMKQRDGANKAMSLSISEEELSLK